MDSGTISAGSVVYVLDADLAPLDAKLTEASGKVETYAATVDAANKSVEESAATVAASAEASTDRTVAASAAMAEGVAADDEAVVSRNALTVASFNALGDSLEENAGISKTVGVGAAVVAAGIAVAAGVMVKAAGDFQKSVTQIYSSAGETAPLQTIDNGILQIARDTGTATSQLTAGLYTISSAGYNTAGGLTVLRAAAQGAKAENADLATVTDALTTVMHDYGYGTSQAYSVTNMMIAAVSAGKMHLQDFAQSLSTVLPIAKSVGLSFAQVAGAEATLTAAGVSADQATQDLHAVISTIIAPTKAQVTAMQQMGLSSVELSQNLGKNGLTSTLNQMFDAITQHMGSDGLVLQNAFQNATIQTKDFNTELSSSPAALQKLGNELLSGSISFADFRTQVQSLPVGMTNLGKQMETTYDQMHSFNSQLVTGANASPTFTAELKAMTGQTNSMNAILMLTGANQATFNANVNSIADAAKGAANNISSWSLIQGNFNQQMSELKEDVTTTGIAIGLALLPPLTKFAHAIGESLSGVAHFISDNKTLVSALFITTGAIASVIAVAYGVEKVMGAMNAAAEVLGTGSLASGAKLSVLQEALASTRSAALGLMGSFTSLWAVINGESLEEDAVNPIFAIITAISLLALGIYEVIDHWNAVKGWMEDFWNKWKVPIIAFMAFFAPEMLIIAGIAEIIIRSWTPIKQFFTHLWDDINKVTDIFVSGLARHLAPLVTVATPYFNAIRKDASDAWVGLGQDANTGFSKLHSDLDSILNRMVLQMNPHWAGFKVEAKSGFEDMRHTIGSELTDTTNDILRWGGETHQDLLPAWLQFKTDAITTWDGMRADSISSFKGLKTDIHQGILAIVTDANALWHGLTTGSLFTSIGHTAGMSLKTGWDSATHDANQWGTNVGDAIGSGVDGVKRNAPQWGMDIVRAFIKGLAAMGEYDLSSLINWAKEADGVYNNAKQFGGQIVSDIAAGFSGAVGGAETWGGKVVSAIASSFTSAKKTITKWGGNIIDDIGSGFTSDWKGVGTWVSQLVSNIGSDISSSYKDIVKDGKNIVDDIVTGLGSGLKDIRQWFTNLPSTIEKDLASSGNSVADKHAKGFKGWWESQPNIVKIGDIILLGIVGAVLGIVLALALAVVTLGVAIINGIIAGLELSWHFLDTEMHKIGPDIVNWLSDAGSWLYDTGANIIHGLMNGAGSVLSSLGDWFLNKLPSWIRDPFKAALGIQSPSTVFAGFGRNIVEGLANGITSSQKLVTTAMGNLSSNLVLTGSTSATTVGADLGDTTASSIVSGLQGGSSAAGGGGTTVHVHLNPSGIITTSRAQLRQVTKDMLSSVDDELRARQLPTILPSNIGSATA